MVDLGKHEFGVVIFNLRDADEIDDEKIEALVHDAAVWFAGACQDRDMTFADACCAALEFTARLCAARAGHATGATDTEVKLAASLGQNLKSRILSHIEGYTPGEEPDHLKGEAQ